MKNKIIDYLNYIIKEPVCELNYNKDYELVIAVMLSSQTTDKRVNMVTKVLFNKYKSLKELKEAKISDLKDIIKTIGFHNQKALNISQIAFKLDQKKYNLNDEKFLRELPGVGRKTANVILNVLFNENKFPVDTHVKRVSIRLNIANKNDNINLIEEKLIKYFKKENINKISQQFVLFGRYYCKAIKPKCNECKLKEICNYKKKND